jgi:hypothetical protein
MLTASDIIYDPDTHTSRTVHGHPVPHVTRVLACANLGEDFDALMEERPRMRRVIENARARGTAVHADCHAYDDDDLAWETVDAQVLPFVDAWRWFREDKRLTPIAHGRERRIYHPVFNYTGILDGIFEQLLVPFGIRRILVDIKTGDPASAAADIQTSAYQQAYEYETKLAIDERWAVWLRPGLAIPYRVTNYSAMSDADQHFGVFCAALTVYNEQVKRGRLAP